MAKSNIFLAILNHRNTHNESRYSPAQCLMSRLPKTLLPTTSNLLKPRVNIGRHYSLIAAQQRQTHYYNQHSNDLQPLQNGDIVCIMERARNYGNKLLFTEKIGFRSYSVETSDGS